MSRTPEEARVLAYDLFEQLKQGAAWETLKQQHSDDRDPGKPARGPYPMANTGVARRPGAGERGKMVKAFGDVSFSLKVGEIGIANYDPAASKFGFHIIKRVQ